jgi:hemin uptake protein HemP
MIRMHPFPTDPDLTLATQGASLAPTPPRGLTPAAPLEMDSQVLMGGRKEMLIRHAGEVYRLRVTAQGKLILTK